LYHRPNGWDTVPTGRKIPSGEACMWGDYHALEVAVYLQRIIDNKPYYKFWSDAQ
jgi:unsaturated chondroitin disaccharide hydrolase